MGLAGSRNTPWQQPL